MTERLDRIEAILVSVAERQDGFQADLEAMRQREEQANQQLRDSIMTGNQELRESISATNQQLRESIADTVQMIGTLAERQEGTDQRFNNLLAESRADRQQVEQNRALNESEHRAFRETFQTLLAEIARIWQRLAG